MALPYFPKQGEILICDFDDDAPGAEIIKRRPTVVVSRKDTHSSRLCTVVPLSTTAPAPERAWHHPMPHLKITSWHPNGVIWAKSDLLMTVSFERLNKPYTKTHSGRKYVTHYLDAADLAAILTGIRHYLGV